MMKMRGSMMMKMRRRRRRGSDGSIFQRFTNLNAWEVWEGTDVEGDSSRPSVCHLK